MSKVRSAIGTTALAVVSTVVVFAAPASAAWSSCPSSWNCFWASSTGAGNYSYGDDASQRNISWGARSGYNHGGGSYFACGYSGAYGTGTLNYTRPPGDTESFSYRTIRSMIWQPLSAGC